MLTDMTLLSAFRTAALAAVGVRHLANPDAETLESAALDRYLTKPFSLDVLLAAAKELTAHARWT